MKISKIIFLPILAICLANSCKSADKSSDKPQISVSIPVVSYFIDRIAGDKVSVNVLVPQSVGHSDYAPLPSQMVAVANSTAYFAIGNLDFEIAWRERLQDANADMRWVDLNRNITLISSEHEGHHGTDPHYWLSPIRAKILSQNILDELKTLLPGDAAQLDSAYKVLQADIDSLDSSFRALEREKGAVSFLIYHPALTYLAEDYGFKQFEIEHEGNSPSPQT